MSENGSAETEGQWPMVLVGIYELSPPVDERLVSEFERQVIPILESNRVNVEGVFVAERVSSAFKGLPAPEGDHLLVWFGVVQDGERSPAWIHCLASMTNLGDRRVSLLELEPTARSIPRGDANGVRRNSRHPVQEHD